MNLCIKLRKSSEQLKKGMSQNKELYPKDRDGRGLSMEDRRESLKLEDIEACEQGDLGVLL